MISTEVRRWESPCGCVYVDMNDTKDGQPWRRERKRIAQCEASRDHEQILEKTFRPEVKG